MDGLGSKVNGLGSKVDDLGSKMDGHFNPAHFDPLMRYDHPLFAKTVHFGLDPLTQTVRVRRPSPYPTGDTLYQI